MIKKDTPNKLLEVLTTRLKADTAAVSHCLSNKNELRGNDYVVADECSKPLRKS